MRFHTHSVRSSRGTSRIARTALAVLGLTAFVACSDTALTGTRNAPGDSANLLRTASVSVNLASSSIAVGATTQATAITRDVNGTATSPTITWKSSNTAVAKVSSTGLVTAVATGSATITATVNSYYSSKSGSASLTVTAAGSGSTPPPSGSTTPGTVSNLAATATSASSITLSFTQVSNGSGAAASYDVRFAAGAISWGSAPSVTNGTCKTPLAGTSTSGALTCTVLGLSPSTSYSFQVIAFRGTMNLNAVYGALSNVATATTNASTASTDPVPLPTPTVTTVTVSPASASVAVAATQALSATVKDQNGATMTGQSITWASSNAAIATVSTTGVVTGVAAGSATITATSSGKSGSASISVTAAAPAPTPTVTTVSVSPTSASVLVGATQALSASVKDQNGATMTGQSVSWASSNSAVASVNASGVVTGVAAGSATITATSSGKSGSAAISVTAPAPPPPSSTGGNEPAGFTKVLERGWDVLGEGGWYDQLEDPNLSSKYKIVQDATAPKSASNVGQQLFPVGFSLSGVSPAVAEKGLGNKSVVYVAFWVKVSSNWVGHPSGVLKTLHFWTGGSNKLIPEITGSGSGTLQPTIAIQNTVTSGSRLYMPNLAPSANFTRGVWHKMEYIMTGNTSGANGRVEWWMDGVKVGDVSGLQFNSGAATWELIQVNPTYGGSESGSLQTAQSIYFDHLYVSGK